MAGFESVNNGGSQLRNMGYTLGSGTDGGMSDQSTDNAKRISGATSSADSKVSNASAESIRIQADNAVESMKQKTALQHLSNAATMPDKIQY